VKGRVAGGSRTSQGIKVVRLRSVNSDADTMRLYGYGGAVASLWCSKLDCS